jgi:hypothetical protein
LGSVFKRRLRVVTARIDNPHEATAAFSELGLLRPPAPADVTAAALTAEEKRQARRTDVIAWVVLVLFIGGWIGATLWYVAKGD